MRIYLDVSCLDRPFDDLRLARNRLEAEAVAILFQRFADDSCRHVSSDMVLIEVGAMSDLERQGQVRALLPQAEDIIALSPAIMQRAETLTAMGFRAADATHIAAAEEHRADILLTCDDKFARRARRLAGRLTVEVDNPLSWIRRAPQ
jgi:hypothetical protein